ncbi:hypothetical protein BU24DRAFT_449402 [Aaosphaeria arxii CBS 175.79]|uniref:Uncharacterized protein n=1 Tax=Aaosphaeria arxii CBS 175.79 TaxID=1450172 RepID=A0A6A5XYA2_9PLEO|nr:uncharacterized protein BU24DRAFT_449402 [Aaosphaeria arxii CBS 175.79]KAF2017807.1 hypothetical protein BU24DRAFT_449402 [Aaosphaeria arxii CBS 175.79]
MASPQPRSPIHIARPSSMPEHLPSSPRGRSAARTPELHRSNTSQHGLRRWMTRFLDVEGETYSFAFGRAVEGESYSLAFGRAIEDDLAYLMADSERPSMVCEGAKVRFPDDCVENTRGVHAEDDVYSAAPKSHERGGRECRNFDAEKECGDGFGSATVVRMRAEGVAEQFKRLRSRSLESDSENLSDDWVVGGWDSGANVGERSVESGYGVVEADNDDLDLEFIALYRDDEDGESTVPEYDDVYLEAVAAELLRDDTVSRASSSLSGSQSFDVSGFYGSDCEPLIVKPLDGECEGCETASASSSQSDNQSVVGSLFCGSDYGESHSIGGNGSNHGYKNNRKARVLMEIPVPIDLAHRLDDQNDTAAFENLLVSLQQKSRGDVGLRIMTDDRCPAANPSTDSLEGTSTVDFFLKDDFIPTTVLNNDDTFLGPVQGGESHQLRPFIVFDRDSQSEFEYTALREALRADSLTYEGLCTDTERVEMSAFESWASSVDLNELSWLDLSDDEDVIDRVPAELPWARMGDVQQEDVDLSEFHSKDVIEMIEVIGTKTSNSSRRAHGKYNVHPAGERYTNRNDHEIPRWDGHSRFVLSPGFYERWKLARIRGNRNNVDAVWRE